MLTWDTPLPHTTPPPATLPLNLELGREHNIITAFCSSLLQPWAPSRSWSGYRSDRPSRAVSKITCWKQKWMIDGEMRLFGSRMHVRGGGVEWWTETKRCIFPFLLSAALCYSAVTAAELASAATCKYQPLLTRLWTFPLIKIFTRLDELSQDLLDQNCPNTMCFQDHKSAIVNLWDTQLPTAWIYLFHAYSQITPEQQCHSLQHMRFLDISHLLNISKGH